MDLRVEYQTLMDDVRAGRFAEAVATADRLIATADVEHDPKAELTLGVVMMTPRRAGPCGCSDRTGGSTDRA